MTGRTLMSLYSLTIAAAVALGLAACGGGTRDVGKPASSNGESRGVAQSTTDTATPAPPDEGPVMDGDHSIIRREAVGPLHVGEWRRPVMSFVYAISARAGRDSEDIIVVHGIGKDTATLTFLNDTLRKIFVTHAGPHTTDGIGVGTPFATIANATGARTTTRGTARVATISRLCGVEFATDSAALGADSVSRNPARRPDTVRAISVGYCKQ